MVWLPFPLLLTCLSLKSYLTGRIENDERVIFFPTLANFLDTDNEWQLPVHGWLFEPEEDSRKRKVFLHVLQKSLKIPKSDQDRLAIMNRRVRTFLVDNEHYKAPRVNVLNRTVKMSRSKKNGHFQKVVSIPHHEIDSSLGDQIVSIQATARDGRTFKGDIHLLTDTGLSIISDIDDTVKVTNVTSKKVMLRNTFLEEFQEVPGMAETYRHWQQEHNATFHFVSSSPWQLYEELETFREKTGFPRATFHLKSIRPKDKTILNLFKDPVVTKSTQLTAILERFPRRKFVLVGDSGEKDPEVYGKMARLYPDRIIAIFIRNITNDTPENARMQMAFHDIDHHTSWQLFSDPATLTKSLEQILQSCPLPANATPR